MLTNTLNIRTLTPTIGAEILDVDLSRPTDELIDDLRRALHNHLVLFFRDQNISIEQHIALGKLFGPLHINRHTPRRHPDHPEVIMLLTDENSDRIVGDTWHSDGSGDPEPPLGSILYMREVPRNGGGDTMFASMYAAYEALSQPMKDFLECRTAVHERDKAVAGYYPNGVDSKLPPLKAEHPIIRLHPETGRKLLFVNRAYTTSIVGLPRPESDAILELLYRHLESPIFQCRFKWQQGSIAFWDNRCTQHYAVWDFYPDRRLGQRVTISSGN